MNRTKKKVKKVVDTQNLSAKKARERKRPASKGGPERIPTMNHFNTTIVTTPVPQTGAIWPLRALKRGLVGLAAYHVLPWTVVERIFRLISQLRGA